MQIMTDTNAIEGVAAATARRIQRTVYCPRSGRRVPVLFEQGEGGETAVALCPIDIYSDRFDTPLGGIPCDQGCLDGAGFAKKMKN